MLTIIQKPSANFLKGRAFGGIAYKPEAVVIHIMEGSLSGTDQWFQSGSAASGKPVSAHYGIGQNGEIHQYVKEEDSASHAGVEDHPTWTLIKKTGNPNYYTIGIEHEGVSTSVWSNEMKKASAAMIREICARWAIPLDRLHIIGHYEIKSSKPNCPAVNKGIIDELITLASAGQMELNKKLIEATKKAEELLAILKS